MRRSRLYFVMLAAAGALAGCHSAQHAQTHANSSPATAPVDSPALFTDGSDRISLQLPAGWKRHPSAEYALLLSPADLSPQVVSVSLEIPKLPPHIPGLIPIASVRNGYFDDLRKQFGSIQTSDEPAPAIPDAQVQRVRSMWAKDGGTTIVEGVVLLVHGDNVFLLRATSDPQHEPAARSALDEMLKTLRWGKP